MKSYCESCWYDAAIKFKEKVRNIYKGVLIYAGRYNAAKAEATIENGLADMAGFARSFVANPDLPSPIKTIIR